MRLHKKTTVFALYLASDVYCTCVQYILHYNAGQSMTRKRVLSGFWAERRLLSWTLWFPSCWVMSRSPQPPRRNTATRFTTTPSSEPRLSNPTNSNAAWSRPTGANLTATCSCGVKAATDSTTRKKTKISRTLRPKKTNLHRILTNELCGRTRR